MIRRHVCINPRCREKLDNARLVQLCPSCRYIGKIGLLIGQILAGIVFLTIAHLVKVFS